jgi:phosphoribosylanthranilate isomerase
VPVKVKICGVTTPDIVEVAASAGADFVGLVFFPRSPRNVDVETARALREAARGKLGTVAVMVDPDDALIDSVSEKVRPDLLQLHCSETPQRVAEIKARTSLPLMKAIGVAIPSDVSAAFRYTKIADHILFDAKPDAGTLLPGGNAQAFDWTMLNGVTIPFALSGGLTPTNVADAVRMTGAVLVDVSSGVERAAGKKDVALIRQFIQAAKQAASRVGAEAVSWAP